MLCGSDATLTVSAAAPSRTTEGTGIRAAARSVTGSPPSMVSRPGASPAIATLSIASRPNAHRHAPNCANTPPIAGPINAPIPHVEAAMAEPRLQSERGSTALITAKLRPHSRPPASPCRKRPTSKMSMVGAAAQTRLPTPRTANPMR